MSQIAEISRAKCITCVDVARLAGVTKASVSRVLNNNGSVSEATRDRVLSAVKSLNYRPSHAARILSRRQHETIGLISEIESGALSYGAMLVQGVSMAVTENGYRLALSAVHWNSTAEDIKNLPAIKTVSIDGVIVDAHMLNGDYESVMNELGVPYVFINPKSIKNYNTVMPDDVLVAKNATEYLLSRGHIRIGYIPCVETEHCSQSNRIFGYMKAMANATLASLPLFEIPKAYKNTEYAKMALPSEDAVQGLHEYIKRHKCTGLVVYGSNEATWLEAALYKIGVCIPQDISIIACDYDYVMGLLPVPITSYRLDRREMGKMAVDMLRRRINERANIPSIFVTGSLEDGKSVANVK